MAWVAMAAPWLDGDEAAEAVAAVLGASELRIDRERKGKTTNDDIRPQVIDLAVSDEPEWARGDDVVIRAELATKPRALRPDEMLRALGSAEPATGCRLRQWIESGGAKREPLPLPATRTTRTVVRA